MAMRFTRRFSGGRSGMPFDPLTLKDNSAITLQDDCKHSEFQVMITMTSDDINKIEEMLKYHLQIMATEIHYKLDILIEGCQMLNEKVDRILERTGS